MQRLEAHMAEIGEMPKLTLKDRVREAFTKQGAKEKWYRDHKEIVQQYADVNNGLSEEQRGQAMAQIEADATKSSKIATRNHWLALAGTAATVTLGSIFVLKPEWVGKTVGKIKFKGAGEKLTMGSYVARNFLDTQIIARAVSLGSRAKDAAVNAGEAVRTGFAKVFKKAPEAPVA